jgi:hypothetical protein
MRENRPSGSEGGAGAIPLFLPLSHSQEILLIRSTQTRWVPKRHSCTICAEPLTFIVTGLEVRSCQTSFLEGIKERRP